MCGRAYETYTEEELELRYLSERRKRKPLMGFKPTYNLAPTQRSPVVWMLEGERQLDLFRWGLIPFWAKDPKDAAKYSLINAKSEEITEKRSYKEAFRSRRCIVPVSGFFEWRRLGSPDSKASKTKRPYAIHLKEEATMSLAGVWERWKGSSDEEIRSFSIITCASNSLMESIHNRMPVILDRKDERTWLDPENQDSEGLKNLLKPCPSSWIEIYEISTRVNSPKNDSKDILEPIE